LQLGYRERLLAASDDQPAIDEAKRARLTVKFHHLRAPDLHRRPVEQGECTRSRTESTDSALEFPSGP
jgi:hypothetical protein